MEGIPRIELQPLFGLESGARRETDVAIAAAAREVGFLIVTRLPADVPLGPQAREELFRLFSLPPDQQRRLWRNAWAPENPNIYRGFFPIAGGIIKEGIDIGPEHEAGTGSDRDNDALAEPTPLPPEALLPGWRSQVRRTFSAFERVGCVLMHSLARGLGLPSDFFDAAFCGGNSTLRLIAYPPWPEIAAGHDWPLRPAASLDGRRRFDIGGEHVDSGFVTLLQQDEVGGLQARTTGGSWVDVPPLEHSLAVNFGKLLARWTGGRIRATEHRVLGNERERRSIPFFYEPRIDARIAPLPLPGVEPFEPFRYGDHVWESMTRFAEFADAQRFPAGDPRA